MKAAALLAGLCLGALASSHGLPGVLVVQSNQKSDIVAEAKKLYDQKPPPPKLPGAPAQSLQRFDARAFEADLVPVPMIEMTAQEFDDEGRLTPIAWSLADPIFRAAIDDRLVPQGVEFPTEGQMRDAMGKLKTGYLFVMSAFAENGQIWTQARLLRGTREIWKDEVRRWQSQVQSQFDEENARRSIARTWTQILGGTVLKDLPQRKRLPEPLPPVAAPNVAVVPPKPAVDNKQVLVDVMRLLGQKSFGEAVNLMRDAVDAEPLDAERRETLVSVLVQSGEPALAADEARRAAHLMPDRVTFWVAAARAWIAAERPDEALKDLNEAVAREPEAATTRLLLGEVQVADRQWDLATENLGKALETAPTVSAYLLRAFVRAAQGQKADCDKDVEAARAILAKETPFDELRRFRLCQSAAIQQGSAFATEVSVLIPRIRVDPKDAALAETLDRLSLRLEGLAHFFANGVPEGHRNSTDRLLLALSLLRQTAAGLRGSLASPNEDALTDAAIDLGEAVKAFEAAKKARSEESA